MTQLFPSSWRVSHNRLLPLNRPHVMGILNCTPDSFSDGGRFNSVDAAVNAGLKMWDEGATIIDVGGESTRPGAEPVDETEQIRRTIPIIAGLAAAKVRRTPSALHDVFISIDTTNAAVAEAALDAGADIINDVSAGRDDPAMLPLAAARKCGLVLMHRRAASANDSYSHEYETTPDYGGDVVTFARRFLQNRCEAAVEAGVNPESIVIDPGLGFGKTVAQNFELINRVNELMTMDFSVLSAASRKSFIGAAMLQASFARNAEQSRHLPPPSDRLAGSLAISVIHFLKGVRLFRVHDVAAHQQALRVAGATVTFDADVHGNKSSYRAIP